ncbi:MAG: DUF6790 family protein [Burkholderiales bacterium]
MIGQIIALVLGCFSVVMLIAAVALAAIFSVTQRGKVGGSFVEQLFRWVLLLSVGVQGVYTFILHVFFSTYAAEHIGWAPSPFQFEVGVADLTVGLLGLIAFWSNFSFRVAATIAAVVWYGGDAIGHVYQMIVAHNFAPGNAGPWFWTDVLVPIVLALCALVIWNRQKASSQ